MKKKYWVVFGACLVLVGFYALFHSGYIACNAIGGTTFDESCFDARHINAPPAWPSVMQNVEACAKLAIVGGVISLIVGYLKRA